MEAPIQSNILLPPKEPFKPVEKIKSWGEGIKRRFNEWRNRAKTEPSEVLKEIADAELIDIGRTMKTVNLTSQKFIELGFDESVKKYFERYRTTQESQLIDFVQRYPDVMKEVFKGGVPPEYINRIISIEEFKRTPRRLDFATHAQRLDHYMSMLQNAEQKGASVGFQLRSKAENKIASVNAEAKSMGGTSQMVNSDTGLLEERGLPYTSFNWDSIATGYGDIAWAAPQNVLFRDSNISFISRSGTGEINAYTTKGKLIRVEQAIDKYFGKTGVNDQTALRDSLEVYEEVTGSITDDQINISTFPPDTLHGVRADIEKRVKQGHLEGINLLNSYTVCFIPTEKAPQIRQAITESRLDAKTKSLLNSQIIEYEGNDLHKAYESFVTNPKAYAGQVARSSQFTDHTMDQDDAVQALNIHEALDRTTRSKDEHKYISLTELPFLDNSSNEFTSDHAIAMRDRLQEMPEWNFLKDVPQEIDGILFNIFEATAKEVAKQIGLSDKPMHEKDRVQKIGDYYRKVGTDLTKPISQLDDRRQYFSQLLGISENDIGVNQSMFDVWKGKILPFLK